MKNIIERVSKTTHKDVRITELNHTNDKKDYNVSMIPALVIQDKVISQGKVLSDKEIKKLIVSNATN